MRPTAKQIALLKALEQRAAIAPWSNRDLVALSHMKFVDEAMAVAANGRLHTSKIWTISEKGRRFLIEEGAAA